MLSHGHHKGMSVAGLPDNQRSMHYHVLYTQLRCLRRLATAAGGRVPETPERRFGIIDGGGTIKR